MNWEAIGAVGEAVGAAGVIITLVYLAAQIRHNTKAVNASTFQANTELWQDWYLAVAGPGAAEAYARGMTGRGDIDPMTFHSFFMVCRSQFLNLENQFYQYRQGALDEDAFAAYEEITKSISYAWPGIRAFWKLNREGYGREFAAYIDGLIEETRPLAEHRVAHPNELIDAWKAALDEVPTTAE